MTFAMSPSCKTGLAVLVAAVSIFGAFVAAAFGIMDARISAHVSAALVPVTTSITQLQERQAAQVDAWRDFKADTMQQIETNKVQAREDNARIERGVQEGFRTVDGKIDLILRTLGR